MSQDLKSFVAFDTGAFPTDGVAHTALLTNTWGVPLYIRQTTLWLGMTIGGQGDFGVTMRRTSDGSCVDFVGWDHYADPAALHQHTRNFEPNYMLLAVGDSLHLEYTAYTAPGKNAHVIARVWWSPEP